MRIVLPFFFHEGINVTN